MLKKTLLYIVHIPADTMGNLKVITLYLPQTLYKILKGYYTEAIWREGKTINHLSSMLQAQREYIHKLQL